MYHIILINYYLGFFCVSINRILSFKMSSQNDQIAEEKRKALVALLNQIQIDDLVNQTNSKNSSEESEHKFWSTQPVPKKGKRWCLTEKKKL